jgi:hypothetical protein
MVFFILVWRQVEYVVKRFAKPFFASESRMLRDLFDTELFPVHQFYGMVQFAL